MAARRGSPRRCRSRSSTTSTRTTRFPYRVMGCMQDLGSASGPSNSLKPAASASATGTPSAAARPASRVPDPNDPNIVYAGEYGGIMTRYDHRTSQGRNVTVAQYNPSGIDPAKHQVPLPVDRADLFRRTTRRRSTTRANVLFRTTDGGQTWDKVSRRPDPQRQTEAAVERRTDHRRQHRGRDVLHDLRGRRVAEAEGPDLGRSRTTASSTSARTIARRGTT